MIRDDIVRDVADAVTVRESARPVGYQFGQHFSARHAYQGTR